MIHIGDAQVDAALRDADLLGSLRRAFIDFDAGRAAMQPRVRTDCGAVKLSTLGAVWPSEGFAGAKVYTTVGGRFSFVIVLFDAASGAPLATLDANAITRWRTAAVSVLAAQRFANTRTHRLAVFGSGVQARAHAAAFARAFALTSIHVVARRNVSDFAVPGCGVVQCDARTALEDADLIVTATRAAEPLFDGRWIAPGAFVAAVGSSKPDARELDDAAIARAKAIVVEWREQSLREAGDLVRADPALLAQVPVLDLGRALAQPDLPLRSEGDIVLFKSVGVGLEDVATAGLVDRQLRKAT